MKDLQKLDMSVVMIVRDEEDVLEQSLSSTKDLYREIVVVDTGSIDGTKKIAEKYGAKIYDLEWKNDFSAAKNYALSKATSEWLMILDADEYIDSANGEKLRDVVRSAGDAQVIVVYMDSMEDVQSNRAIKIWKNGLGIKYENKIHEQVVFPPDVDQSMFIYSDIHIIHTGYDESVMESKGKKERNYRLLIDALKDDPENEYLTFQLAKHLDADKRSEDAYRLINEFIEKNGNLNFAPTYRLFIKILSLRKSHDYALKVAEYGIKKYPEYLDLRYLLGNIRLETGYLDDAIELYRHCINEIDEKPMHLYPRWHGVTSFLSFKGMALAYLMKNDVDRALDLLLKSIQCDPEPNASIKLLAMITSKHFPPEKVRDEFSTLLRSIDIDPSPYIRSFDQ